MTDNSIPEEYRRKALYAALYHHDGVDSYAGGESNGDPIRVELIPPNHPESADSHSVAQRRYIKRVAGALGFAFSSEGPFMVKLTPDTQHALAGLRGEYNDGPNPPGEITGRVVAPSEQAAREGGDE